MVLPHYCAGRLKDCLLLLQYIYLYINILCSMNVFDNNTKSNVSFLPDLILHLFTFLCSPINVFFPTNFRFYKMIVHSRFF